MSVVTVQFLSPALGKQVEYTVLLPDVGEGPFPVLLQLHGLSDTHRSWVQRSNIVRHVERLPMIVVFPDGGTSGYVNWPSPERLGKQNYEDLLVKDIPTHLARHFQVRPGRWAIGGLSMGGYGSMRLGLKYPEQFGSIWAHSAAFRLGERIDDPFVLDRADLDVFALAEKLVDGSATPLISFDCGVDDVPLIEHNRELHAHLNSLGLAHHYAEHPGAHTWEYWDTHVQEAIAQHASFFEISPVP